MISCSTYMIIWSCIMVIWYMNLYDYMILYVLIFLSVSELICLQLEKRACLGRDACSARCEARVSCWRELCTVFVLEGTQAARMKKIDCVFVCPLLQYTTYIFVGFYATKHPQVDSVQKSYAQVIAMQPGPVRPTSKTGVWENNLFDRLLCGNNRSQAARVAQPPARQTWG